MSQAGKAESQKVNIRQLDLCGRQEVGGHSHENGKAHDGDFPKGAHTSLYLERHKAALPKGRAPLGGPRG